MTSRNVLGYWVVTFRNVLGYWVVTFRNVLGYWVVTSLIHASGHHFHPEDGSKPLVCTHKTTQFNDSNTDKLTEEAAYQAATKLNPVFTILSAWVV